MEDCIFCRIAKRDIPSDIVYEDDEVLAFKDLNPQAPVHVLFITKRHIASMDKLEQGDAEIVGRLLFRAKEVAREQGIAEGGYRVVLNCNRNAGQEVFHIHAHLLGGRKFAWPPG